MIAQIGNSNSPFIGGNPTPTVVEVQSDLFPNSPVNIERTFTNIQIINGNWRLQGITPSFTSSDYQINEFVKYNGERVKILAIDYVNQRITIDYFNNSIQSFTFKRDVLYKIEYDITTGYINDNSQPLKNVTIETLPDIINIASVNISSICRTRFKYDNKWERFSNNNEFIRDTDLFTPVNINVKEYSSYGEDLPLIPQVSFQMNEFFVINGNTTNDRGYYSKYTLNRTSRRKAQFLRNSKILLYEPESYLSDFKYNCDVAFLVSNSEEGNPPINFFLFISFGTGSPLIYQVPTEKGYYRFNVNNDDVRTRLAQNSTLGQNRNYLRIRIEGSDGEVYIEDKVYFADKTPNSLFPVCSLNSTGSEIPTFLGESEVGLNQVFVSYLTTLGSWETFLFRGLGSINIETTNEQSRNNWIYNQNNTRNINNEVISKTAVIGGTLRSLPLPQSEAVLVMRDLFTSLRVFDSKGNLLILDENSLTVDSKDKNVAFSIDYKYSINPLIQKI